MRMDTFSIMRFGATEQLHSMLTSIGVVRQDNNSSNKTEM